MFLIAIKLKAVKYLRNPTHFLVKIFERKSSKERQIRVSKNTKLNVSFHQHLKWALSYRSASESAMYTKNVHCCGSKIHFSCMDS